MINNEKVKLMTKLAIYEKKNEEDIKLSKYYKVDYVKHNILKTLITVTIYLTTGPAISWGNRVT